MPTHSGDLPFSNLILRSCKGVKSLTEISKFSKCLFHELFGLEFNISKIFLFFQASVYVFQYLDYGFGP